MEYNQILNEKLTKIVSGEIEAFLSEGEKKPSYPVHIKEMQGYVELDVRATEEYFRLWWQPVFQEVCYSIPQDDQARRNRLRYYFHEILEKHIKDYIETARVYVDKYYNSK